MDSAILSRMSKAKPSSIPYIIVAPPAEGYTIANAVADEGASVLMFCEEHLLPPQYRRFNEKMTVFGDLIDNDAVWAKATEVLEREFDAIFLIEGPDYWAEERDLTWPLEDMMLFHIFSRAVATGRRMTFGPSGTPVDKFPDKPMALLIVENGDLNAA